jgi:hypothetical protein
MDTRPKPSDTPLLRPHKICDQVAYHFHMIAYYFKGSGIIHRQRPGETSPFSSTDGLDLGNQFVRKCSN